MALTDDELKALDTATLERLVAQLMTAIRSRNIAKLDRALDAMVDFSARTPFPELQVQAAKAQSAASKTIAEEALAEISAIADQMGSAEAGFKAAAKVAESGKKELLFPTLADAATRGLELVKEFQKAVDVVKEKVDSVDELGEVPQALNEVEAAFKSLKEKLEEVEIPAAPGGGS